MTVGPLAGGLGFRRQEILINREKTVQLLKSIADGVEERSTRKELSESDRLDSLVQYFRQYLRKCSDKEKKFRVEYLNRRVQYFRGQYLIKCSGKEKKLLETLSFEQKIRNYYNEMDRCTTSIEKCIDERLTRHPGVYLSFEQKRDLKINDYGDQIDRHITIIEARLARQAVEDLSSGYYPRSRIKHHYAFLLKDRL